MICPKCNTQWKGNRLVCRGCGHDARRGRDKATHMSDVTMEFTLRPWSEVARIMSERTGQRMSRQRAWQLGMRAITKLRAAFEKDPRE